MYVFIVNPTSGNGRGAAVWSEVESRLQTLAVTYRVRFTSAPDEGSTIVAQELQGREDHEIKAIIAVGGDGTIHDVVNGLVHSGRSIPLGVIPAGSGNDLARVLAVTKWEKALEAIVEGETVPFDIGVVNDRHYFINSVGVGFDAAVSWVSNRAWYKNWLNKLRLGKLAYVISVIRLLFTYRSDRITIETENMKKTWDKAWLVAVANIESYGGGMKICPDAQYADGKYQLCIVHGISALHLLMVFPKVFSGSHKGHRAVELIEAKQIRIETTRRSYVHMDGEVKITAPISLTILPQRVQVLKPLE